MRADLGVLARLAELDRTPEQRGGRAGVLGVGVPGPARELAGHERVAVRLVEGPVGHGAAS